jgi:putative phage-type endonuclease
MSRVEHGKTLLEKYGFDDQRTAEWHLKRGQMLTASEIYKGLAEATPAQRHELIMSKLVPREHIPPGQGPRALLWGTRFEPIAKKIYCELQHKIHIADTTCIPHSEVPFLGASPDGVILTDDLNDSRYGKLVEFKCPISRQFTDQSPVPNEYYHQMQLQMECTGIDECEYIEMQFKPLNYTEWVDCTAPYKSFYMIDQNGKVLYKDYTDPTSVADWREKYVEEDNEYTTVYWMLNNWRSVTVKKQQNWLSQHLPSLTAVWEEVLKHRQNGTLPENPKEKSVLLI